MEEEIILNQTESEAQREDNFESENGTAAYAEAERENPATGKFSSVEALLKAYTELEAEFTRRSQKLRELENKATPSPANREDILAAAKSNPQVKDEIIREYLAGVLGGKGVPLTVEGGIFPAPKASPKSVKEAGRLADSFLKN